MLIRVKEKLIYLFSIFLFLTFTSNAFSEDVKLENDIVLKKSVNFENTFIEYRKIYENENIPIDIQYNLNENDIDWTITYFDPDISIVFQHDESNIFVTLSKDIKLIGDINTIIRIPKNITNIFFDPKKHEYIEQSRSYSTTNDFEESYSLGNRAWTFSLLGAQDYRVAQNAFTTSDKKFRAEKIKYFDGILGNSSSSGEYVINGDNTDLKSSVGEIFHGKLNLEAFKGVVILKFKTTLPKINGNKILRDVDDQSFISATYQSYQNFRTIMATKGYLLKATQEKPTYIEITQKFLNNERPSNDGQIKFKRSSTSSIESKSTIKVTDAVQRYQINDLSKDELSKYSLDVEYSGYYGVITNSKFIETETEKILKVDIDIRKNLNINENSVIISKISELSTYLHTDLFTQKHFETIKMLSDIVDNKYAENDKTNNMDYDKSKLSTALNLSKILNETKNYKGLKDKISEINKSTDFPNQSKVYYGQFTINKLNDINNDIRKLSKFRSDNTNKTEITDTDNYYVILKNLKDKSSYFNSSDTDKNKINGYLAELENNTYYSTPQNTLTETTDKLYFTDYPKLKGKILDIEYLIKELSGKDTDLSNLQNLIRAAEDTSIQELLNNTNIPQELKEKLKNELNLSKKYIKANVSQGTVEISPSTKDGQESNTYISQKLANRTASNLNTAIEALKLAAINLEKEKYKEEIKKLDLSKEDLDKFLSGIDSATDKEELNNILEEAKRASELKIEKDKYKKIIDEKQYLTSAQKTIFKNLIDKVVDKERLDSVLSRATSVDDAMKSLREEVTKKTIKDTSKYTEADQTKKSNYDTKLEIAEKMIDDKYDDVTTSIISTAMSELLNARVELNGDTLLTNKKLEITTEISKFNNLNDKQKEKALEDIKNAITILSLDNIKENYKQLDASMGTLISQVSKDLIEVKGKPKYELASIETKTDYDNALIEAKKVSEKLGELADKAKVDDLYNKLKQAFDALNGEIKLLENKNQVEKEIDSLLNINNKQKEDIKSKINLATTLEEIEKIKENSKNLDTVMKEIKDLVNSQNNTKNETKYTNASETFKKEYDKQKDLADKLIIKETGENKSLDEVKSLKNSLTNAYNNLDGDKQLDQVKETAKSQIDSMLNLNDKQKEALKSEIEKVSDKNSIQAVLDKAKELDDAMKELKEETSKYLPLTKDVKYLEEDAEKKKNYTDNFVKADAVVKSNGENKTVDEIKKLTQDLKTIRESLEGDKKLADAKQNAITELEAKTNLNNSQKENYKNKINFANSIASVNTIKSEFSELDTAMSELKAEKEKAEQVKNESKYINSESELKDKLNAELGKATGIVDSNGANADKTQVDAIKNTLKAAIEALNGDTKLKEAKDNAKLNLDNLNKLQKQDIDSKMDSAKTIDEVTKLKNEAIILNNAMADLKQLEKSSDSIKQTDNYKYASEDKKKAYDEALEAVKKVTVFETGELKDILEVNELKSKLELAERLLNGDLNIKEKDSKKDRAITEVSSYLNLNNNQKIKAIEIIKSSDSDDKIDKALLETRELDLAMEKLINEENEFKKVESSPKYKYATNDKKETYLKEYSNTLKVTNKISGQDLDKDKVLEQLNKLSEARKALDGDGQLNEKKKELLAKIKSYQNLNNAQKLYYESEIDKANDFEELDRIDNKSQSLDIVMGNLKNLVENSSKIKQDERYKESLEEVKKQYEEYIEMATMIVDKEKGILKGLADVQDLISNIEKYEKLVLIKKIKLDEYDEILDALNYRDVSIVNKFNDNFYFDVYLNKSFTTLIGSVLKNDRLYALDLFMGGQLGFNIDVTKNIKVGGFLEYMNKGLNHISLGANVKGNIDNIHSILGFARYRLALGKTIESKEKLLNHNFDVYVRYNANIKKGDITLMPKIGLYLSYLDKVRLDTNVELKSRLMAITDIGAELSYQNGPNRVYVEEFIKFTLNDKFVVYQTNLQNNIHVKDYQLFEFISRIGWEYTVNNYKFGLNTEINHNGNFKMGVSNSYNW